MDEDRWFVKKPCKNCPFRMDVRPFLRPERAEELAYAATNRYSSFQCHKTLEEDEDGEDMVVTGTSLECAGFLSMQIEAGGANCPDGFNISRLAYSDPDEMIYAYEDEAAGKWTRPRWLPSPPLGNDGEG